MVSAVIALILVFALKLANIVAWEGFGRPFAPLADLPLIPTAIGTLARANILAGALGAVAGSTRGARGV